MLQDNYTQDLPIFKGVTVKYFRESEDNNSYEAFIEMPVKEHHCPHCGYTTWEASAIFQRALRNPPSPIAYKAVAPAFLAVSQAALSSGFSPTP